MKEGDKITTKALPDGTFFILIGDENVGVCQIINNKGQSKLEYVGETVEACQEWMTANIDLDENGQDGVCILDARQK